MSCMILMMAWPRIVTVTVTVTKIAHQKGHPLRSQQEAHGVAHKSKSRQRIKQNHFNQNHHVMSKKQTHQPIVRLPSCIMPDQWESPAFDTTTQAMRPASPSCHFLEARMMFSLGVLVLLPGICQAQLQDLLQPEHALQPGAAPPRQHIHPSASKAGIKDVSADGVFIGCLATWSNPAALCWSALCPYTVGYSFVAVTALRLQAGGIDCPPSSLSVPAPALPALQLPPVVALLFLQSKCGMQRLICHFANWQRCAFILDWHNTAHGELLQRVLFEQLASEPLVCNLMSSFAKVLFATFRSCKEWQALVIGGCRHLSKNVHYCLLRALLTVNKHFDREAFAGNRHAAFEVQQLQYLQSCCVDALQLLLTGSFYSSPSTSGEVICWLILAGADDYCLSRAATHWTSTACVQWEQ